MREIIAVNRKTSKEINCLEVNNKIITDIKNIANEFNISVTTFAKIVEKKLSFHSLNLHTTYHNQNQIHSS